MATNKLKSKKTDPVWKLIKYSRQRRRTAQKIKFPVNLEAKLSTGEKGANQEFSMIAEINHNPYKECRKFQGNRTVVKEKSSQTPG